MSWWKALMPSFVFHRVKWRNSLPAELLWGQKPCCYISHCYTLLGLISQKILSQSVFRMATVSMKGGELHNVFLPTPTGFLKVASHDFLVHKIWNCRFLWAKNCLLFFLLCLRTPKIFFLQLHTSIFLDCRAVSKTCLFGHGQWCHRIVCFISLICGSLQAGVLQNLSLFFSANYCEVNIFSSVQSFLHAFQKELAIL